MDTQNPKIVFYAKRSFTGKMNATFDFIKENWKILLKYTTCLLLPVCILQAFFMNALTASSFDLGRSMGRGGAGADFLVNYGATVIFVFAGYILLTALVYTMMLMYNERPERLVGVTMSDLREAGFYMRLKRGLFGFLFMFGFTILATVIIFLPVFISPYTLILTLPLFVACLIPVAFFIPVYMFENIGLTRSFVKSFRLGFATWGGTFLFMLILGIISAIVSGVTSLPATVAIFAKNIFSLSESDNGLTASTGYSVILYLLGVIQAFGMYLSFILNTVGMGYQYAHACEKTDNVSVVKDIENFEQL